MTNSLKLKALLVENGLTQKDIAKTLGKSIQSVNKKINGKVDFRVKEMDAICKLLKICELNLQTSIFFANSVELNSTNNQISE